MAVDVRHQQRRAVTGLLGHVVGGDETTMRIGPLGKVWARNIGLARLAAAAAVMRVLRFMGLSPAGLSWIRLMAQAAFFIGAAKGWLA
jgi:hypothetical protein